MLMQDATIPVLTIDGPAGSGKGTVSQRIAQSLRWHLLDSGALYRLVGLLARQQAVAMHNEAAVADLARHLPVRFVLDPNGQGVQALLDGEVVDNRLRTEQAGHDASVVAALPAVREALLQRQRDFAVAPGLVADGRDMGTVVFPNALLKVFLTASVEERAQRRYKQLQEQQLSVNLDEIQQEIALRDQRDAERSTAPLRPAEDAWVLDTTSLPIDAVVVQVLGRLRTRLTQAELVQ